jgi:hypothetical protein
LGGSAFLAFSRPKHVPDDSLNVLKPKRFGEDSLYNALLIEQ